MPKISPKAPPRVSISPVRRSAPRIPARNAAALYTRYCVPSRTRGSRHTASTASSPATPTVFLTAPAPASTASAASARMLPTTGNTPTAPRASRAVTVSAEPAAAPDTVRYRVNSASAPVSSQTVPLRMAVLIPARCRPGSMASAAAAAT